MKLPEGKIDKFFLEQYIAINWDSILGLIAFNNAMCGSDIDEQIYEELKKYKLSHVTLKENDEK